GEAVLHELRCAFAHASGTHIKRERLAWPCKRPPVRATFTVELRSGKSDAAADAPHGQRDACVSGTTERCRDARHDLVRQSCRFKRRCFLSAAPEDERIAALQAAHPFALPYQVDEHPVDRLLLYPGFPGSLADGYELRFL